MIRSLSESLNGTAKSTAGSLFYMTLIRLVAFVMAFQGVPLPFIPYNAPEPLRIVKEIVEPQQAQAAQIKRVLRGQAAVPSTDAVMTVALGTSVDMNKSFILTTTSTADADPQIALITPSFDDSSTLLLQRGLDGTAATVEYMVVEFASGVTVQRGATTFSGTTLTKTITLPSTFNSGTSFPLIASNCGTRTQVAAEERVTFTAELSGTNQLKLDRNESGATSRVDYQVVSFDTDIEVNSGAVLMDGTAGTGETTDTGTVVTVDNVGAGADGQAINTRSMLLFTRRGGTGVDGIESRYEIRGEVGAGTTSNTTKLTFTRVTNSGTVDIYWYLVEFKDNTFVDRLSVSNPLTTGTTYTIANGGARDERTLATVSVSGGGTAASGTYLDETLVRGQLTGIVSNVGSTVTATRGSTASNAEVRGFVTEFPPIKVTGPNGAASQILRAGDAYTVKWDFADHVSADTWDFRLSQDSGATYLATALSCGAITTTGNTKSCDWIVPDTVGGTNVIDAESRLKITDSTIKTSGYTGACNVTSTVADRSCDASDADFKVKGRLQITAPNGGEAWPVKISQDITWKYCGQMDTCTLKYSTNGGGAWTTITSTEPCGTTACTSWATAPSKSYPWTSALTDTSENVLIKIEDNDGPAADTYDQSDAVFAIRPAITVVAPANTDQWLRGRTYPIKWCATGLVPAVDMYFSGNTGATWPTQIANDVTGTSNGLNTALCPGVLNEEFQWSWAIDPATVLTTARASSRQASWPPGKGIASPCFSRDPSTPVRISAMSCAGVPPR